MNLWMTTVFTNADICTVGTCFTVDDTMSYVMPFYLKELLIFLRNTGLNVADQQEFFSLISGLVIISHLPVLAWN